MLTGLHLGNFKAFGETQHIPIKPLTLIFGANSAGKSSIIHGLLLAHHASETGDLDVHQMQIGGEAVDLGGFKQYVHRRNSSLQVTWGVTIDASEICYLLSRNDTPVFFEQPSYIDVVLSIELSPSNEVGLGDDYPLQSPEKVIVKACDVKFGGKSLLHLVRKGGNTFHLQGLNGDHPLLRELLETVYHDDRRVGEEREAAYNQIFDSNFIHVTETFNLMKLDFLFPYHGHVKTKLDSAKENGPFDDEDEDAFPAKKKTLSILKKMECLILMFLSELISLVEVNIYSYLTRLSYLGPLRSYPARHLAFPDLKGVYIGSALGQLSALG